MIGQAIELADPNYQDFYTSERLAQTYSELIKREPILRGTAAALGFEEQWRVLRGQVAVSLIPGTQLMEIRVTDTDPERARLVADQLAAQLMGTVERARPEDTNRQFIQEQANSFPPKIQAAQTEIQSLEAELSAAFSARQIQDIQSRINTLENQISNWQSTYAQYQLLLGDKGTNILSIVETAGIPNRVGPQWMMQVLLAAAIGATLALGAAFLIEYLDDTLKTPEDVTRVTGLTTVGAITRIEGRDQAEKLVTARHPKSPVSEAFRVMRTNLQFSSLDHPLRSLVVTSPQPTEGKSTTVANLGVVMAQAGKRVVLVDDSIIRGTTLVKIVAMLRQAGAREVHIRISAPPTIGPCHYGIDTPTREELIAHRHSVEEIRAIMGADSLGYLGLEGLRRCGERLKHGFCDACFSDEYPVPPSEEGPPPQRRRPSRPR